MDLGIREVLDTGEFDGLADREVVGNCGLSVKQVAGLELGMYWWTNCFKWVQTLPLHAFR